MANEQWINEDKHMEKSWLHEQWMTENNYMAKSIVIIVYGEINSHYCKLFMFKLIIVGCISVLWKFFSQ